MLGTDARRKTQNSGVTIVDIMEDCCRFDLLWQNSLYCLIRLLQSF